MIVCGDNEAYKSLYRLFHHATDVCDLSYISSIFSTLGNTNEYENRKLDSYGAVFLR